MAGCELEPNRIKFANFWAFSRMFDEKANRLIACLLSDVIGDLCQSSLGLIRDYVNGPPAGNNNGSIMRKKTNNRRPAGDYKLLQLDIQNALITCASMHMEG